jgi:hypothetical protein
MLDQKSRWARFDGLLWASLGYLLLPYLMFVMGWLRWPVAVGVLALLAGTIWWVLRHPGEAPPAIDRRYVGWLGRLALVLLAFSGVGGLGWQHGDYLKHHLIWLELARHPWPLHYQDLELGSVFLDYYLAYYLPVGLLGKWLGTESIPVASYLWTGLGMWLGLVWLLRLSPQGWGYWLASVLLVGWPGTLWALIEIFPYAINTEEWLRMSFVPGVMAMYIGKSSLAIFSSFEMLSLSVQHFLPTYLGSLMLIDAWQRQRWGHLGLLIGSLAFWSLFVAVAMGLIALGRWLTQPTRGLWQGSNVSGILATMGVLIPYYLAHFPIEQQGWLLAEMPTLTHKLALLAFLIGMLLPTWGLITWGQWRFGVKSEVIRWGHLAVVMLLLVMWYWVGRFNDSFIRVGGVFSILIHLGMGEVWQLTQTKGRRWERGLVWLIMLGLMFNPLLQMGLQFSAKRSAWGDMVVPAVTSGRYPDLTQINDLHEGMFDFDLRPQYFGRADSWFGRNLLRPAHDH